VKNLPVAVAFETPDDFAPSLALFDAAFVAVLGARVEEQAGLHDPVQDGVGLPVAAAVEATVLPTARGTLDRTDPTQSGQGRPARFSRQRSSAASPCAGGTVNGSVCAARDLERLAAGTVTSGQWNCSFRTRPMTL
jgi:hypothetical protein